MRDETKQECHHFQGQKGDYEAAFRLNTNTPQPCLQIQLINPTTSAYYHQVVDQPFLSKNSPLGLFFPSPQELAYYLIQHFKSLVVDEQGTIIIAMSVVEIQHKNITVSIPTQRKDMSQVELLEMRVVRLENQVKVEKENHQKTKNALQKITVESRRHAETLKGLEQQIEALRMQKNGEIIELRQQFLQLKQHCSTSLLRQEESLINAIRKQLKHDIAQCQNEQEEQIRQSTTDMEAKLSQKTSIIIDQIKNKEEMQVNESYRRHKQFQALNYQVERMKQKLELQFRCNDLCHQSNILTSQQVAMDKAGFLLRSLKFPKKINLIYRASEHAFKGASFHSYCDGIENTMVLIKTEFHRVIGGFTPLAWDSANDSYVTDKKSSSFIFSLDMMERFQLNDQTHAIYCHPFHGPTFGGGHDICIDDACHKNDSNCMNFPHSYHGNNKYQASEASWTALVGNPTPVFKVTEYEVFQVHY